MRSSGAAKTPGHLISALVAGGTTMPAKRWNADELLVFVLLLLLAGNETTTKFLIGNGMLVLGRNPR